MPRSSTTLFKHAPMPAAILTTQHMVLTIPEEPTHVPVTQYPFTGRFRDLGLAGRP